MSSKWKRLLASFVVFLSTAAALVGCANKANADKDGNCTKEFLTDYAAVGGQITKQKCEALMSYTAVSCKGTMEQDGMRQNRAFSTNDFKDECDVLLKAPAQPNQGQTPQGQMPNQGGMPLPGTGFPTGGH